MPKPIEIKYEIDENGCHVCTSHVFSGNGYPCIRRGGKNWRLSRYIYTQNKGEIPKGELVRHTCDNMGCINPDHLILGTYLDNNRDKVVRGRMHDQSGQVNHQAMLTNRQVLVIFKSKARVVDLAKKYKVSAPTIYAIRNGRNWTSITGVPKKRVYKSRHPY